MAQLSVKPRAATCSLPPTAATLHDVCLPEDFVADREVLIAEGFRIADSAVRRATTTLAGCEAIAATTTAVIALADLCALFEASSQLS